MFLSMLDCYKHEPEKWMALVDIEHRFNEDWAAKLGLYKDDNLLVVQPPNAESATDIMSDLIKSNRFSTIGFDSIGQASNWREQQQFSEQNTMYGGVAGVMTRHVKTIAPIANLHNVTLFYMNQLRADMEGFNRPMTPGGHAVKHMMSIRIHLRPGTEKYYEKVPGGEEQVGFPIGFKTVKNSFGPPFREVISDFYNQPSQWLDHVGFDVEKDLQKLGILTGVITQAGAWYSYKDIKGQGRDSFFKLLKENDQFEEFKKSVWSRLCLQGLARIEEEVKLEGETVDDPDV